MMFPKYTVYFLVCTTHYCVFSKETKEMLSTHSTGIGNQATNKLEQQFLLNCRINIPQKKNSSGT